MARSKVWTKERVIDKVKHLAIAKNKALKDITINDIRDAGLYHAIVSEFKGYKNLKRTLSNSIKNPVQGYVLYMEDIYKNVLKVSPIFYDKIRNVVYGQFRDIDAAHKKRKVIRKYMDMIEKYRQKHGKFPSLSTSKYQYLYRLIKGNSYITTEMFDMIDFEDDKIRGEWLKWLDKIEERFHRRIEQE
ncbi:MAG: hypothetical protein M0Z70_05205 [Nitrospiraceae bacterium]|nr:hypothetical protein [Nitrospiraceae bacterium]